jgi:hypothetical protein
MCTTAKECILTWVKNFCLHFDRKPHGLDHFYRIANKEGLQVVLDSTLPSEIEMDNLFLTNDNRILINASSCIPEGDSLVCSYAKLFHFYYLSNDALQDFHSCLKPVDKGYVEVCLAAGLLAVAPCCLFLDDLRTGIDPGKKYQLSPRFAQERTTLILNHLRRQRSGDSHDTQRQQSLEESIALCEGYMEGLEKILGNSPVSDTSI